MLGLVKPISVGICGDASAGRRGAASRGCRARSLACHANQTQRLADVRARSRRGRAELDGWLHEKDAWSLEVSRSSSHMHPRQMLRELERAMPAGAMVSTDIGNICSVSNSYLRFERPRSMFAAMSFGNCGYAFPTIIGAKVAAPDRPAIAYVGDGAWGMSFGELQTCVRENIPVTAVVFNNGQWGAEKKNHVDFYDNRFVGVNLDKQPSWAAVARAMGAEGTRIDKTGDVGPALRAACDAQKQGKTTVLEMMVTRELGDPFRRDALALPTRHLAKYRSTAAKHRPVSGCRAASAVQRVLTDGGVRATDGGFERKSDKSRGTGSKRPAPAKRVSTLERVRKPTRAREHSRAIELATTALAAPRLSASSKLDLLDLRAESYIARVNSIALPGCSRDAPPRKQYPEGNIQDAGDEARCPGQSAQGPIQNRGQRRETVALKRRRRVPKGVQWQIPCSNSERTSLPSSTACSRRWPRNSTCRESTTPSAAGSARDLRAGQTWRFASSTGRRVSGASLT